MSVVYEWDPLEREYIQTDRSDDKKYITFATDMDVVCNCVCCGKEMKYGDGYTSRRFHTVHGFGYCECEECYKENWKRGW